MLQAVAGSSWPSDSRARCSDGGERIVRGEYEGKKTGAECLEQAGQAVAYKRFYNRQSKISVAVAYESF